MNITLTQLVPTLQLAVGPVILISGVGLLLLSFTNRLGRLIDRRAGILRWAITLAALTVLFVSIMILVLFSRPCSSWSSACRSSCSLRSGSSP